MIIKSLDIKGVLAVRAPLSLDFAQIPAGSLVAIVGPIGNGKTTILEAPLAAVHRSFPSREKPPVDYATERDSYIDLRFELAGKNYRARLSMDNLKRSTDAVLQGTDQPDTDGRVSTFDAAIATILPPLDMMLASSFSAQNKAGNFVTLSPKQAKELFAKLIGLERYEPMAATAKNAAALVSEARLVANARRQMLTADACPPLLQVLDERTAALEEQGEVTADSISWLEESLAVLEGRLSMVSDQAAAYQSASLRVRTLRQAEAEKALEIADARVRAVANDRWHAAELAGIGADIAKQRQDLEGRIANNRTLLDSADQIREAHRRIVEIDAELATARAQRVTEHGVRDQAVATRRQLEQQLAALVGPSAELDRARRDAEMMRTVPCGGQGQYARCQFLTAATIALAKIPILLEHLAGRPALVERVANLSAGIGSSEARLERLDVGIRAHERERISLEALTVHADKIAAAEARIAEYERQLPELNEAELARISRQKSQYRARATEILDGIAAVHTAREALIGRIEEAEADLATTETDSQQAVQIQADLMSARRERDGLIATTARVQAELDSLAHQRVVLVGKQRELATLEARIAELDTELVEWQTLAKALSRDGLPVLEIDAAGPTVSTYTNELLHAAFGTRFTVELVTQEAKVSGKGGMKESFQIKVWDAASGGETRDIADLSGGEQVIVGEALANAISVFVNTRSQCPIRTMFRDETVGSLDPENATRYVAMLRKVVELGGFYHALFISHNLAAAALADVQIRVLNGTAHIVYPPFTEAA